MNKFDGKGKEVAYRIRIAMEGDSAKTEVPIVIDSDPFTLVSSFTQLPDDLKEKRQQRTGKVVKS
jgi:3-polyprenyl-4-hydroxybenzoate decarboxylase